MVVGSNSSVVGCKQKTPFNHLIETYIFSQVNATTGEHVDVSDLGLVGAQLNLIKAVKATGKKVVVVYVSGKPIAETWVYRSKSYAY